ncbi:prolyl 4-hydroxylase subunit alpha-1-like protein [Labeo rohita]|uniref:procollagen-proline 4-dioxygenase n=1 Tax=Labeo rohita TaxID=84645 RepID=A0A498LVP2_LABRO|nr:prolyl 4-hydroxylase subunit alpha-1-like protein [Labeo rohita]
MKSLLLQLQLVSYLNPYDSEKIKDPVASYKLLRRVRTEWLSIVDYAQKSLYKTFQTVLTYAQIPQGEDWRGAASGLIRLQEIYKLYPHNITKDTALTADEAYYVGLVAYSEEKFQLAFLWFLYSLERVTEYSTITKQELLHYLCSSAYHFGSLPVAIYFCQLHLNLDPDNDDVKVLLNLYKYLRSQRTSFPDIFTLSTESNESWNIVVSRVNQRIADITGLSQDSPEDLFVQNYGIGGRYEPHYDEWMSDVEKGGATVFPTVGVALKPEKGSAVFWYNLHKNGNVDLQTQHAGCPVLRGNKWDQIAQLYEMKKDLLMSLSQCIDAKEEDVEMKSALQNLLLSYSESEDPEKAVRDPVAAYKLLRRLRSELIIIIEHFQLTYQCNTYEDEFLEIPELEDLDGAASGLIRLQEIYKLYPQNITNETSLNADEAYHVGWVAHEERKFQHAFLWFLYSLNKLTKSSITTEKELLYYLKSSAFWFGSLPQIYFNQQLPNLDPSNDEVKAQLNRLLHFLGTSNPDIFTLNTESSHYETLCRGEIDEMANLQEADGTVLVFLEEDNPVVSRVSQRIADITGLSKESAEDLQIQNYGIGGRYEPHYDAWDEENERIATFLIYMSDVEKGGATVFPQVGVALKPKKGSAVFWYNLHKNGNVDLYTEHAGCPVLREQIAQLVKKKKDLLKGFRQSIDAEEKNVETMKSVHLKEDNTVVACISQRTADIKGLSMKSAEELQDEDPVDACVSQIIADPTGLSIVYLKEDNTVVACISQRIADFTGLSMKSAEELQGSAVFWYNLHKNGNVDWFTEHAGCPVLRGNKWVANKWIHEFGQEFRRPCTLSYWE